MSFAAFTTLPSALWRGPFQLAVSIYTFFVRSPEMVGGKERPSYTCRIMPNCQSRAIQPSYRTANLRTLDQRCLIGPVDFAIMVNE
jgi:hypothetical protein